MKQSDNSTYDPENSTPHTSGPLDFQKNTNTDLMLNTWLYQATSIIQANKELKEKIKISVHSALARAEESRADLIHLRAIISIDQDVKGKPLGFFLIEKIENTKENNTFLKFEIELYVYQEGE